MTAPGFCNKLQAMKLTLEPLENQIDRLLELYRNVRAENSVLRANIADLEASKRALQNKIEITVSRLETLRSGLPVE